MADAPDVTTDDSDSFDSLVGGLTDASSPGYVLRDRTDLAAVAALAFLAGVLLGRK